MTAGAGVRAVTGTTARVGVPEGAVTGMTADDGVGAVAGTTARAGVPEGAVTGMTADDGAADGAVAGMMARAGVAAHTGVGAHIGVGHTGVVVIGVAAGGHGLGSA